MPDLPAGSLSLIVPVFNEERSIADAIGRTVAAARRLSVPFEVVAVDDGSRDRTPIILAALRVPELRVVTHGANRGLGAAVQSGMQAARGTFCIVAPVDNPLDAETLERFLRAGGDADLVLGYRLSRPGYSPLMRFNSWLYHLALRLFCGLRYRDVNWIHMYRRARFAALSLRFGGVVAAAETVLRAQAAGCVIREIPCAMVARRHGRASAARLSVMLRTARDLVRLLAHWSHA